MITLASDFGSPYPAAMKGVILDRTDARLVDIAHDFPRQDVHQAAFWLREILPYFPEAVHLLVIDPGVGTDRKVLVVEAGGHILVGPDNGVLIPVAETLDGEPQYYTRKTGDPRSTTFHGRDVFAPLAADIHEHGVDAIVERDEFDQPDSVERVEFPEPRIDDDHAAGEILVVDDFGNAITNIPGEFLDGAFGTDVQVDQELAPARHMYAAVGTGEQLVTVGSHGHVELAVNQGRGDDAFGVAVGDSVRIQTGR